MYRNEWDAAVARAAALETQLKQAQSAGQQDAATIAMLSQQLQATNAELARLRGGYGAPSYGAYGAPNWIYASRASTVLTLGILSLVICGLLGPIAWSMGNTEIQRIDMGQTDPSARGTANAGRICGMVASIMLIVGVVMLVLMFGLAAGTASSSSY